MYHARCNLDGRPISPADQAQIDTFATWLQMDDTDRKLAIRLDPQWRKWAGIDRAE